LKNKLGGKMEVTDKDVDTIKKAMVANKAVLERFSKIQETPSLYGSEKGLTNEGIEILGKLIQNCGEVVLAGDAIMKRFGH
jgi:hypothetical protein